MDFTQLLSLSAVIVALVSAAWVGLQRGRIADFKELLEIADRKVDQLKEELIADKATIARQGSDLVALQRVVTGEVHWQAISDVLDHHHQSAERHWSRDEDLLEQILEKLIRGKP